MGGPGSGRRKKKQIKSEMGYAEKIWASQKNNKGASEKVSVKSKKLWGKTKLTATDIKSVESHVRKLWEYRNGR